MRLGAWLQSKGKISTEQLEKALQHQAFFGGRLGSSLIKLGYIDEVIKPRQTRWRLIQSLRMLKNKRQDNPPKKHGNIPL